MKLHNSKLIKSYIKYTFMGMFTYDSDNMYLYYMMHFMPSYILLVIVSAFIKISETWKLAMIASGVIILVMSIIVFIMKLKENIQWHERYIQSVYKRVNKLQASLEDIDKNSCNEAIINSYISTVDKCYCDVWNESWGHCDDERVDKLLRTLTDISDGFKELKESKMLNDN